MKITTAKLSVFILLLMGMSCFSQKSKKVKDSINGAEFNVVPYINYNKNLDFMFGVIPMYMYPFDKEDTISPKSLSGLSAVYTTNKSYFLMGSLNYIWQKIHGVLIYSHFMEI
ncbi:hypothetical protein [Gelidibacter mesophilus]|uniref:hypothetical protein n=1 Tax=Gelidibacter mesophilus TaxID=169050 RepID=UPI00040911F5|nr:hypothetical protein [Gelidibacter mesophilus]